MSTNFYLDSNDNDAGHLGKRTSGHFIAKAPQGIDSFDQWAAHLNGRRIVAESGYEVTADEMVEIAVTRDSRFSDHRRPRYEQGEFVDRGVLFVRHEFC
jgi:hypothetical protein